MYRSKPGFTDLYFSCNFKPYRMLKEVLRNETLLINKRKYYLYKQSGRTMLRYLILAMVCVLHTVNAICTEVTITSRPVTCNGGVDGEVTVEVSEVVGNYIIRILQSSNNKLIAQKKINNIDTSLVFTGINAGNYIVHVITEQGEKKYEFVISEPSLLKANTIKILKEASSNCKGAIEARPSGGTPPYIFSWSENSGNSTISRVTNLCQGIYRCIITDSNKCTEVSATVYLPMQLKNN